MKLNHPLVITPTFGVGIHLGSGCLEYRDGSFVIWGPFGEHVVRDFQPGLSRELPSQFEAMLDFMGACAESRQYAVRNGRAPMDGENSSLFPDVVGEWLESVSDEIDIARMEISEANL